MTIHTFDLVKEQVEAAQTHVSSAGSQAVTTAYSTPKAIDENGGVVGSEAIPTGVFHALALYCKCTTLVTATTVTVYLSADAAGAVAITDAVTKTLVVNGTSAGFVVSWAMPTPMYGTSGKVYVVFKTDAGTITVAETRLYWRRESVTPTAS